MKLKRYCIYFPSTYYSADEILYKSLYLQRKKTIERCTPTNSLNPCHSTSFYKERFPLSYKVELYYLPFMFMYSFETVTGDSTTLTEPSFVNNKKLIKIIKRNKKNKIRSINADSDTFTIKISI